MGVGSHQREAAAPNSAPLGSRCAGSRARPEPDARTPEPSHALAQRYDLGAPISVGARSIVHAARDQLLRRDVVMKVFTAGGSQQGELQAQHAEARLLACLNHHAVTTLFDAGLDTSDPEQPRLYLVLEPVLGCDLRERLRRGALSTAQVCWLGSDLAEALEHDHAAGFIHHDVKPANVLLADAGPTVASRPGPRRRCSAAAGGGPMSVSEMSAHRRRRRASEPEPAAAEADEAVGLDRVGPHHWQVVDRRRPIGDPFRVLALIAAVGGSYEVMQFGKGFEWSTFASMDHALANVVVTSAALARTRSSGPDARTPDADAAAAHGPRAQLHALPRPQEVLDEQERPS